MEKMFKTLVKEDHKFGKNEYILGSIYGIKLIICDGKRNGVDEPGVGPLWEIPNVGHMFSALCTQEQYDQFKEVVEKHYPGLCIFNYQK